MPRPIEAPEPENLIEAALRLGEELTAGMARKTAPIVYVPTTVRKLKEPREREPAYGIGWEYAADVGGGFNLTHGPFKTIEEALEIVPDENWSSYAVLYLSAGGEDVPRYWWRLDPEGYGFWLRADKVGEYDAAAD
jgi:hypothetical protein